MCKCNDEMKVFWKKLLMRLIIFSIEVGDETNSSQWQLPMRLISQDKSYRWITKNSVKLQMNDPFLWKVRTVFVKFEGFWVEKNKKGIYIHNQRKKCDIIGTIFKFGELPL